VAHLRRLFSKLLGLFRNTQVEEDLKREIASHLVLLEDDFKQQGMSREEAHVAARRAYGGVEQAKQLHRDERSLLWLEQIRWNVRYACRQLSKSPGFTFTVLLILALGIGAATATFSLVDGILLRPLPFSHPDRLILLGDRLGSGPGWGDMGVTAREIDTYSKATGTFAALGGYTTKTYELSGDATPEVVHAARLTAGVFPTLGIQPILGRAFTAQEENADQPLAVISYGLWLDRYHGDPGIAGRSIELNRKTYSIIGVMPRSFEFPLLPGRLGQAQLWVPMSLGPDELSDEAAGSWGYHMVARLKEGVSVPQAAQDVDRVARQIMRDFPAGISAIHIRGDVMPLLEHTVASAQLLLRTLFLAVSIVLLIACVNVAVLLLVRAIRRRREYALRLALGARFGSILGESLLEGLLLSFAGGLLGIALAASVIRTALHLLPESMPRIHSVSMNATVATFALLLALACGILCSLAPAFAAGRTNLLDNLKEGSPTGTGAKSHTWLRSALVASEIAIALMLLTISGAFLRSYQKMLAVDPGFRPDHVLVAGYRLPPNQYPSNNSIDNFNREVIERLSNEPGIATVGITDALPASGGLPASGYTLEGVPAAKWKLQFAYFARIYGDYFRAMGIPLIEGRYFTVNDRSSTPLVVIVNQSMAKHCWPGQNAIGKRFHAGNPRRPYPWVTVIGIVADTKIGSRDEPSEDQYYAPTEQPATFNGTVDPGTLTQPSGGYILLRSVENPQQMIHTLRSAVGSIDPLLALDQVQTMDDALAHVEAPRRFNTVFITAFTIGALALAVTGIYAVVAFSVSLRVQEIAVRMALGAQRASIARLVLFSGARIALLGCSLGVVGSLLLSRLFRSFLFDVSATDPVTYVGSILIMMLIALLASALPATRAASTDPIGALR
jgi:predicted permease